MKPDFQRIQSLLREAVTMLCKNSLPYKQELCVEGLLGITLDKEDIFLVNIKEILKPHEIISSVDNSDGGQLVARERSDDSQLVVEERSLSPANYNQEERDNGESNVECGAVSTRAVVPIFKAPNKVQRSHKRAVSNTELSHHWFTSLTHQGSGDPHTGGWEDGGATPPHNKRRHLAPSHHMNSPAQTIDVDSLPVMEVKKEALDDCVMANYQFHQNTDNLSELTNYPSVCRGEAEVKHILPVSLPSIAGLTSSSWRLGSGDVLSTSMPTLPNLSSDMVSAGLPSSHFNNSLVLEPTTHWSASNNSTDSSTTSRGWDNDTTVDHGESGSESAEQTSAWAMSVLRQWVKDTGLDSDHNIDELAQLNKDQLTSLLSRFMVELRLPDGSTYAPGRLLKLLAGVQSYLATRQADDGGQLSPEPFTAVRHLVESQTRPALSVLRSRRPSPAALSLEQEDLLWRCGALGNYNGAVLLHTLVYLNSRNFLIGCGHHHRRLRYADPQITIHEPPSGPAFLQYVADGQGGERAKVVYADLACPSRCHVNIYRKYVEKCPHRGRDPLAFYVAPKRVRDDVMWFSLVPVGHNGLQVIVPELLKRAQSEQALLVAGIVTDTQSHDGASVTTGIT